MAEYNPSKIIKDGNTYNFRDTTKIPLAGSNQISGSLVPSTDGTVNLGSSTAQWNNAYIKSLTINGTQFLPSDYATLSGLSTVATSGSYNDLSNKPTIPKVNNGTLTIQQNGTTVDTFTANSSSDKTINITTSDDTKIPLAGSDKISGDLIPSTGNTIDIGSSSKKIKSVFANYLNDVNLSTLFNISNVGYKADLDDSTLRVKGKIIVCSYNTNTLNNPTPGASGLCFTLANQDSSDFGAQVSFSNKGIYARFINNVQYSAWGTIIK